jgi:hypothetical protein
LKLECIIYRPTPQEIGNTFNQSFVLCKGLIKYNKMNDITPMKTCIEGAQNRLLAKRKLKLINIATTNHFDINISQ